MKDSKERVPSRREALETSKKLQKKTSESYKEIFGHDMPKFSGKKHRLRCPQEAFLMAKVG